MALVDALLEGTPDSDRPFLLDGQAIVLVDYLRIRPERSAALAEQLQCGAVEAGPWFVLADNLIPSGEAILRNLEAGARTLARLGAHPPAVAYCPDSFGHPAAMPMIAAQYGFPVAIVWRGLGGTGHPPVDTLRWVAPDGSDVLVHHLPPGGYEFGSALPIDVATARERWGRVFDTLGRRNRTGVVLLPSGADHHARQPSLNVALERALPILDALGGSVTLTRTSLTQAAVAIARGAEDASARGIALPVIVGELRDSCGYTWALQGTFATRAHQKRANARLERALTYDVEPWIALAFLHAGASARAVSADGRITLAQLPALLANAWETLLRTHPHDTLCGCSGDEVAQAMTSRQASVRTQIAGLRRAALETVLRHDTVEARGRAPIAAACVIVRNRAARTRGGIAEIVLCETIGDVPVGPGSASAPPVMSPEETFSPSLGGLVVQLGRARLRHDRRESPQHYPDDDIVREVRAVAWIPPVPACGLRIFTGDASPVQPPAPVRSTSVPGGFELHNGKLTLRVDAEGVSVVMDNRVLRDVLRLTTVRDAGDSYTASLRGETSALRMVRVRNGVRGPLRCSVVVDWEYRDARRPDERSDVAQHESLSVARHRPGRVRVRTTLILDAEASHLRCDVRIRNRMRDHRLQLVWNTDVAPDAMAWADAAFGPVERKRIVASADAVETPPATMPLHRWVASADRARSATLFADGLAEAEVHGGHLAVTLLRAIGELSRADLPERPGHAGWPLPIPAAQSQGVFHARVGLLLHGPWSDETIARIEESADTLLLPLVGETWRDLDRLPASIPGPELSGEGLRASAITLSRDARALIVRAVNVTDSTRAGAWRMPHAGPWRATPVRFDETPLGPPVRTAARIPFTLGVRGVTTIRIEPADD